MTDLERIIVIILLPPKPTQSIFAMHKKLLHLLAVYTIFKFYMLTKVLRFEQILPFLQRTSVK